MDNNYGGVIWTKHALSRLRERGIKQGDAWATWNRPEQTRYATSKGAWIYYRSYGNTTIEVVAKKNSDNKWLILSVWSKARFTDKSERNNNSNNKESLFIKILRKIFF